MFTQLKKIWDFRGFVIGSVRRDFESRYRHSMLGAVWTVLVPLSTILIYVLIFTKLMNARLPNAVSPFSYSIFLCTGMIAWSLFAEILSRCNGIFIENANLIKKLNFPRISLVLAALGGALINFAVTSSLFVLVMLFLGNFPKLVWLAAIPVLLIQLLFATGLGVIFGVINVFFRDMGQLFGIIISLWFWTTPIVYPINILPDYVAFFVSLNPMAVIVTSLQSIVVDGVLPPLIPLVSVLALAIATCLIAVHLYKKRVNEMVDEL